MKKRKIKYDEINLDKPLMTLSYFILGYLLIRAYNQKVVIDLIIFSCFFICLTLILMRDFKKYKPFIVKKVMDKDLTKSEILKSLT